MKIVYSDAHYLRAAKSEIHGGELVSPFESPQRMEYILKRIDETRVGEIVAPNGYDDTAMLKVHCPDYIEFLKTCWQQWVAAGYRGEALPFVWPSRSMPSNMIPQHIDGRLGYYALAGDTSITEGTWNAALNSRDVSLTATDLVLKGERVSFALSRPPGHHAAYSAFGGYCFLNNAAIAAQHALDQGLKRVAILDVDFHHGNGTQDIFYERDDVMFVSLHGDPTHAFPHFLGHASETGRNQGEGYNYNYPLPVHCDYRAWRGALEEALKNIDSYNPGLLIVSLGVDTYENDPISFFKLKADDFTDYGKLLGSKGYPTVFIMEGGYAVKELGINVVNVLTGFSQQAPKGG